MPRPRLLGGTMLAVGVALLVAGTDGRAGAAAPLRIVSSDSALFVDPSVAATRLEWQISYATGLRLVEHPDAAAPRGWQLVPGAAALPRVSRNGRVYVFRLRPGLRFSNGRPVRAAHFARALNRSLRPELDAPGGPLLTDGRGGGVVGATAVLLGRAKTASGIRARGLELEIKLSRPDPKFLAILAFPIFQAIPLGLRADGTVTGTRGVASAGPYYVASVDQGAFRAVLRPNRFYRGARPRRSPTIEITWRTPPPAALEAVDAGRADLTTSLPADAHGLLAERYGTKGRYRVNPSGCLLFLALNPLGSLFRDNLALRRAVNYVIDRHAMVAAYEARYGEHVVAATDQYITPEFPGFADARIYPLDEPAVDEARSLAAGSTRRGVARYPRARNALERTLLAITTADLEKIGIRVDSPPRPRRTRGLPDIAPSAVCAYSPEPDFFDDVFLVEPPSAFRRRLASAERLHGAARLRAIARLDAAVVRNPAPAAAWGYLNDREFLSERVDPRSVVYQPFYGGSDLAVLALR